MAGRGTAPTHRRVGYSYDVYRRSIYRYPESRLAAMLAKGTRRKNQLRCSPPAHDHLRDSFPDRTRQRYGDTDYDWEHRVDTTGATLDWHTRLLGLLNSPYQPIPPDQFQQTSLEHLVESIA